MCPERVDDDVDLGPEPLDRERSAECRLVSVVAGPPRSRSALSSPVLNIEQLDVRDMVAIRQGSDAFATWRARLSLGLERAHRLRDELGPGVDLSSAIDEVLADAREELRVEARRSAVFGRAGWISFVAGALGGAIAGVAGGAPEAALGLTGGTAGCTGAAAARS